MGILKSYTIRSVILNFKIDMCLSLEHKLLEDWEFERSNQKNFIE